jgi:tRNA nucleotidyltransferase (CCA-adding enzyme)
VDPDPKPAAPGPGPRWETFAHGADVGVRGFGPERERAFEAAALAVTGVVTDPARVRPELRVDLACTGADDELLLYGWLNALIAQMAVRGMLFSRFAVAIERDALSAAAWGEPVDVARHRPCVEVKGATFTEMRVRRGPDGLWVAQCIVDV